nr:MAG TPA: hypothetical protein [Caudoviricetes sp.]
MLRIYIFSTSHTSIIYYINCFRIIKLSLISIYLSFIFINISL